MCKCFQGGVHTAGQKSISHGGLFWAGGSTRSEGIFGKNVKVCVFAEKELWLFLLGLCHRNLNLLHLLFFREESFSNYTLIPVDEEFSRGRGLDIGAHDWKRGDVLMFFCDVDIHFTLEFLNTCRLHAAPSRSLLYTLFLRFIVLIIFLYELSLNILHCI